MNAVNPEQLGWRGRAELGFERWGFFVCRQRWPVLVISILFTGFCASFLPGLTIDNSTEAMLLADDPAVVLYNEFRAEFSRDDRVLVAVRATELFDLEFLERLRELHRTIEQEVPFVEEVDSLINAHVTRGEGDVLIVEELMEDWPENPADLARLREAVVATPLYEHTLVSPDLRVVALAIKPFTYSETGEDFAALAGFDEVTEDAAPPPT